MHPQLTFHRQWPFRSPLDPPTTTDVYVDGPLPEEQGKVDFTSGTRLPPLSGNAGQALKNERTPLGGTSALPTFNLARVGAVPLTANDGQQAQTTTTEPTMRFTRALPSSPPQLTTPEPNPPQFTRPRLVGTNNPPANPPAPNPEVAGNNGTDNTLGTLPVLPTEFKRQLPTLTPPPDVVQPQTDTHLPSDREILNNRIRSELTGQVEPTHHKWRDAAKLAAIEALQGFAAGGPAGAIGAAATGFGIGAFDRRAYPRVQQQQDLQRDLRAEQFYQGQDEQRAKLEGQQTENELHRAQIPYWQQRPWLEQQKQQEQAQQRERQAILSNLRLLKGQKLDPNNPRHAALLQRAANAGIEIDPDSWNDASSNLASVTTLDPNNPTQRRQQFYNKATGELTDVAPSGYVQPVISTPGKDYGQTPGQARNARERERHDTVTESQGAQRITQGDKRIALSERTQAALERHRQFREDNTVPARVKETYRVTAEPLVKELERLRRRRNGVGFSLNTATDDKTRQSLQGQANQLDGQIQDLTNKLDTLTKQYTDNIKAPASSGAQPTGAYAGQRFPRSKLGDMRQHLNQQYKLNLQSDADVEQFITSRGGTVVNQ